MPHLEHSGQRLDGYLPIGDYGVIGDLETAALVGIDGAIDFLCFPSFDSPSVFAALLDPERGGSFRLAPLLDDSSPKQLYLPDTNILLTRFLSDEGVAEISDFMAIRDPREDQALIRRAKTVHGEVHFRMACAPRFDYGRAEMALERDGEDVIFRERGRDGPALRLRSDVPVRIEQGAAVAEFVLRTDERAWFVLEDARANGAARGTREFITESFKQTLNFWHEWIGRCRYRGRWGEMVRRSALTLKLLFSRRNGSLVAAPTFGLPEIIGGPRNWDYRYTWIRDASFTVYALMSLGYTQEAREFIRWVEARCSCVHEPGTQPLQVLFSLDGRTHIEERELPHLRGYRDSRPVRVGNAVHDQLQLDIYGELLDSVSIWDHHDGPISHGFWQTLRLLGDWVCANWQRKDWGIWESRGDPEEFLHSRLMCWVALDRALRIAARRSLPAPVQRWTEARDAIHDDIHARFFDPARKAFMQFPGALGLDASSLLMPMVGFIGAKDPRWLSTLQALKEELVEDSLVYRYRSRPDFHDGVAHVDGTFSMCTFWYAENLARSGDVHQARLVFEKMLGYSNHVGLYAEELGPRAEQLGNFPQAFTHLSLISAALYLDRTLIGAERGSPREPHLEL